MSSNTRDEPSPAVLTACLVPVPLLLQVFFNLIHQPVHEHWRIGWLMSVIALVQCFCLWRRVVVGVLVWLGLECACLVLVNVFLFGVPAPAYSGESRLSEGWLWSMFGLVGLIGGGVVGLMIEPWYRLWQLTPRPGATAKTEEEPAAPDGRSQS